MFFAHLFLLLYKNLLVLWRSKLWFILEFIFPIIIVLVEHYIIPENGNVIIKPHIFHNVPVLGNENDANLKVRMLPRIWPNCFERRKAIVMYTLDESILQNNSQLLLEEFGKRYSNKISLLKMDSEKEILDVYKNKYKNDSYHCNPYIVSLHFQNISEKHGLQYKFIQPGVSNTYWMEKTQWIEGDVFGRSADYFTLPKQPPYWSSGIITFQVALNEIFLNNFMKNINIPSLSLRRMPLPEFHDNIVFSFISKIPLLWLFVFSFTVIHSARDVVAERESKVKAYLYANGVKAIPWFLSHFIITLSKMYINIAIMSIPLTVVLKPSTSIIFYIIVFSFGFSLCCFSLFITSFCKKSSTVTSVTIFTLIIMKFLSNIYEPNRFQKTLCFLSSINIISAFNFAINTFCQIENSSKPLTAWSLFQMDQKSFTLGDAIFMLLLDGWIMLFLTFILDALFPKDDSMPMSFKQFLSTYLPIKFNFKNEYDRISLSTSESESETIRESELIWNENAILEVKKLVKSWNKSSGNAVDGVSFSVKKGNTTVLLGHNGAGKSTTFSMLTGITAPTYGEIKLFGKHLYENLDEFRKNIGYCPQDNPIFNNLTVGEQLKFIVLLKKGIFGKISGKLSRANKNYCDVVSYLERLKLIDKVDEYCSNLSGGMKRKLSVCMALCGGSEMVFLDEPTSGMDVEARQDVAILLNEEKKSRAILLTTHYMDEADSMGDRIIIMGKGRVLCDGTSDFLKKKFGTGYQLTFTLENNSVFIKENILEFVKRVIPNAVVNTKDTSGQFSIILPINDKHMFSQLFKNLEKNEKNLQIKSFGLSLNTLEQVFLKVGELADGGEDETDSAFKYAKLISTENDDDRVSGIKLIYNQMIALFRKQIYYYKRNLFSFLMKQLPFILFFIGTEMSLVFIKDFYFFEKTIKSDVSLLGPIKIPLQDVPFMNSSIMESYYNYLEPYKTFQIKKLPSSENITSYIIKESLIEPPFGIGAKMNSLRNSMLLLFNGNAYHSIFYVVNVFFNVIANIKKDFIKTSLVIFDVERSNISTDDTFDQGYRTMVLIGFLFSTHNNALCSYIEILVDERISRFKHQQLLTKLNVITYWISFLIFNFITYSLVMLFYIGSAIVLSLFSQRIGYLLNLCTLYYFAVIPFIYWMSFLFNKPSKANSIMNACSILIPIAMTIIINLIGFVKGTHISENMDNLLKILVPGYNLLDSLLKLKTFENSSDIHEIETYLKKSYMLLIASACLNLILLTIIQSKIIRNFVYNLWNSIYLRNVKNNYDENIRDDDVIGEIDWVNSAESIGLPLIANNLTKYYGKFKAVDDLSFGVNEKDCFGLLGINGAGKTTTFDMLTGTTFPTSGEAYIKNISINNSPVIGYCPQFDALLSDLSPYESMSVLSQLNGFIDYKSRSTYALESVDMLSHSNKKFKKLSGGQKRKISLSIAIMANTGMMFLDEPTSGIDPKARRAIWNLLTEVRKQKQAILLTSHSMEECETLCTKIGFMNKGKLSHIGTSQHLKSKFGSDYILEIIFENPSLQMLDDINDVIVSRFDCSSADIKTLRNTLRWNIPKINLTWSVLYEFVENLHSKYSYNSSLETMQSTTTSNDNLKIPSIKDYSITQNSLEQVFLRLSAMHEKSHRED
ncbi:ATP-binding cassette sub-family A member 2 [Strongyloides ratti]|uniref:ATP-binding cassette sub-family A member 2 n=1 Tax=Strongyloides ratti TaxID=34506 RepID=A0A090LK41_STRRB|nr:ATP-binding cassette sub-family A member 2 [Strongyloides ratti]CEF67910.1 ATP-binding cassette sub-family A member 2 [Strongyloides ratti]